MKWGVLHSRWLGRVEYHEASTLQRELHARTDDDYLLLLEHPHVYTIGSSGTLEHVLVDPHRVGAQVIPVDRGGDVTYHGPGQLVGYPIITLEQDRGGLRDVVAYVRRLEAILIGALACLGVEAEQRDRLTGVWVGNDKIAAIGVKVARGRTRHGLALNVDPDLSMFDHIVPCGLRGVGVTSLARELGEVPTTRRVYELVSAFFAAEFGYEDCDLQAVAWPKDGRDHRRGVIDGEPTINSHIRLAQAGVHVDEPIPSRPKWLQVRAHVGSGYQSTKALLRAEGLSTVCEEAGCPNIYECWADRTATFMILGTRCTRGCGFCLVDTRKPVVMDHGEPQRVARAVEQLGLAHAVVTSVARDDLDDGGAAAFAATVGAIRSARPSTTIEVLIPDCRGDPKALDEIFSARPDVLNHNLETIARLQRAVRPNAAYARSLAVLARAKAAGLTTKSGLIVGLGENPSEVHAAMRDLRAVGVDLLTVGQYLRPTAHHLPVARWWTPEEFDDLGRFGTELGFAHVEAGPLVRSSYHARRAATAAGNREDERRGRRGAIGT